MISKQSIENLKLQVNIIDIIGAYVDLRKNGVNYSACCPFHNEKTPSFMVNPSKNIFHCYGCDVGGDSITFIMQKENLPFKEAVEKVAEMINFTLEYEKSSTRAKQKNMVLDEILIFYQDELANNKVAKEYLGIRGISEESIKKFHLGYCPQSYKVIDFLNAKKLSMTEALDCGIVIKNEQNEFCARFTNRIMFPIHSANGKVVGFGGRTIEKNAKAKYINSAQSAIFNKSTLLYGYHLAKESIFKEKKIIICEGYLDVIMLHQANWKCAVATLGTALTENHIRPLKSSGAKIILGYDGDNAGKKAALRASKMLSMAELEGGVVIFANNLDPADMVKENKLSELYNLFNEPIPFIDFVLENIIEEFDISNPIQKQKAFREIDAFLKTLSPIIYEEYKNIISLKLHISSKLINVPNLKDSPKIMPKRAYNIAEAVLIITLMDNLEWQEKALEYIDRDMFLHHQKEFDDVLNGENVNTSKFLRELWINEKIKKLENEEELKAHLRMLIIKAYQRDIGMLKTSAMDINKKFSLIKDINDRILKLKSGELLNYKKMQI